MGIEYLTKRETIGVVDWLVFLIMIFGSTIVGFYFGYWRKDKIVDKDAIAAKEGDRKHFDSEALDEYFVGQGSLKPFPVGMTLVGSYISAVTILGTPQEMYLFGTQQMMVVVAIALSSLVVGIFFMPVFLNLQVDSSYEYLEIRFNKAVRTIGSILFIIDNVMFMPVLIYIPVIATEMLTGIDHMITTVVMVVLCALYTMFGGVKVVVYTDTWQVYVMFASVCFAVLMATIETGGFGHVIETASEGERWVFFNFDLNLYERYTFWCVVVGNFCYWTSFNSVNQTMVQRYMSLPSIGKAQQALAYFAGAMMMFELVIYFGGLVMYTYFEGCDPLLTKHIEKADHLVSKFILYSVGNLEGITGFFMSGVFGAALSSLSVILNSLSLVLYNDIFKIITKTELSERNSNIFVKTSIIIFGILGIVGVPIINLLDTVYAVAIGLTAICNATAFSIFALGMLVPMANWYGAVVAAIVGFLITGLSSIGTHVYQHNKQILKPYLPLSNRLCPQFNLTERVIPDDSWIFPLFRLSYLWVNIIGVVVAVTVGILVSLITGPKKAKDFDAAVFSPIIHFCLPDECFENSKIKRKKKQSD